MSKKPKVVRVVPPTHESEIWGATIFLMGLVRTIDVRRLDALVVMDGMGERWRIAEAIKDWESPHSAAQHLIIGGQSRTEKTWVLKDIPYLQQRGLTRTQGVVINPDTPNTYEQSVWVVDQIARKRPESVGVYVSPYTSLEHILRYLKSLYAAISGSRWYPSR